MSTHEFRSPANKLIAFFKKSRDSWKIKYTDAKYTIKKLERRLRYLTARKLEHKERIKELEGKLSIAQDQKRKLMEELEALKKSPFQDPADSLPL